MQTDMHASTLFAATFLLRFFNLFLNVASFLYGDLCGHTAGTWNAFIQWHGIYRVK